MKIELCNYDLLVNTNKLQEITNPIHIDYLNNPTPDGLFSYDIFGKTPKDRKYIFAYIDLQKKFINPVIYKLILTLQRNIIDLISGKKKFKVVAGYLTPCEEGEDTKGSGTGIEYLISVWDKIKFKGEDTKEDEEEISDIRKLKLSLLRKATKSEIFIDKWIVMPPFYRDINFENTKIVKDDVNDLYARLLNLTRGLKKNTYGFAFASNMNEFFIQETLLDIYEYFKGKLEKKRGILSDKLLAKAIDYSARFVIVANDYNSANSYEDLHVDYEHTGVPLAGLCSLYFPLILKRLGDYFMEMIINKRQVTTYKDTKGDSLVIRDTVLLEAFSQEALKKVIKNFIKNPEFRTQRIYYTDPTTKKDIYPSLMSIRDGEYYKYKNWLELFYVLMSDIIKDKAIYITRYPVDNFQNLIVTRIAILTTAKTVKTTINGNVLTNFPVIYDNKDPAIQFIDTVCLSNSYLATMGADFDGDTVSIRSVFSQEANVEALEIMNKKIMTLNASGGTNRPLKNEGHLTFYMLTKDKKYGKQ